MKILVACEESQVVCIAFRNKGHEAYSADIQNCSGGHPEWHIKGDVLPLLKKKWDMIISFPPCTYLTVTGNRWFDVEKYGKNAIQRHKYRKLAIDFFMQFTKANSNHICIENPVGVINSVWQKPSQIIHPYYFGDPERKSTCLWLKNLPFLKHKKKDHVIPNIIYYKNSNGTDSAWHINTIGLPKHERSKVRSKTFSGIAKAMADQWDKIENYRSGFLGRFICK